MEILTEGSFVSYMYPGINSPLKGIVISLNQDEAYIHFPGQDRRIDSWIKVGELKHIPKEINYNFDKLASSKKKSHSESEDIVSEKARMKHISRIYIGSHCISAWYFSPYPPFVYSFRSLYICDFCAQYFTNLNDLRQHHSLKHEVFPPGREIYRKDSLSVFEIKGRKQKLFCQCLCLLGKLFIEHKASYFDVNDFVFYVLCECDDNGAHIAAYYSREANMTENILSCIVVLPPHQRKGYGSFLISLSYEIARRSQIIGGPERPLSDLGKAAYMSYWREASINAFQQYGMAIQTIDDLTSITGIAQLDLVESLSGTGVIFKGKRNSKPVINPDAITQLIQRPAQTHKKLVIDPQNLVWFKKKPYH